MFWLILIANNCACFQSWSDPTAILWSHKHPDSSSGKVIIGWEKMWLAFHNVIPAIQTCYGSSRNSGAPLFCFFFLSFPLTSGQLSQGWGKSRHQVGTLLKQVSLTRVPTANIPFPFTPTVHQLSVRRVMVGWFGFKGDFVRTIRQAGVPFIRSQMRGLCDGAVRAGLVSFLEPLTPAMSINYHVRLLAGWRWNLCMWWGCGEL